MSNPTGKNQYTTNGVSGRKRLSSLLKIGRKTTGSNAAARKWAKERMPATAYSGKTQYVPPMASRKK